MGKIYVGQNFKIELTTNQDITSAQSVKIRYKKPNGTVGEWMGIIVNSSSGIINYNVTPIDNNAVGKWTVWAKITDVSGNILIGEPSSFSNEKEGY